MEDKILAEIDKISEEMIQGILEVVRIDSVKSEPQKNAPFGKGVKKALDKALELAEELGFETVNVDNYVGYAKYGESEDYIGVMGHLDVVETGEGWTHPPFSGYTDENGRIFSRGILDNKGPVLSCLYALYALSLIHI